MSDGRFCGPFVGKLSVRLRRHTFVRRFKSLPFPTSHNQKELP